MLKAIINEYQQLSSSWIPDLAEFIIIQKQWNNKWQAFDEEFLQESIPKVGHKYVIFNFYVLVGMLIGLPLVY